MNLHAIRQSLSQLDAKDRMDLGEVQQETAERLRVAGLPEDLLRLVTTCWPQTPGRGYAGPFRLATTAQLVTPDLKAELAEHGLLFFASAGNGDAVVVDVSTPQYPVLIVDHSRWDGNLSEIRSIAAVVSPTLEEFFQRAANDPEMPGDYWDVREELGDGG